MKKLYLNIVQGATSKADKQWHSPKFPDEKGWVEYNNFHGLMTPHYDELYIYPEWGSGNYLIDDNGKWVCVASNWDSSG